MSFVVASLWRSRLPLQFHALPAIFEYTPSNDPNISQEGLAIALNDHHVGLATTETRVARHQQTEANKWRILRVPAMMLQRETSRPAYGSSGCRRSTLSFLFTFDHQVQSTTKPPAMSPIQPQDALTSPITGGVETKKPLPPVKLVSSSETEDEELFHHDEHEEEELARLAGFTRADGTPDPLPVKMPQFSFKELRAAVPKHCFERSLATSMSHLVQDLFITSANFYIAYYFHCLEPSTLSHVIFWPGYWLLQGTQFCGIWIMGHECGHQAFSPYQWVNDLVGYVIHSALLTPYFSWKISHRHHHAGIGSMEDDEVFVPMTRTEYKTWREAVKDNLEDTPLFNLYNIFVMLTIGWMPGYLVFNATGPAKHKNKPNSHFNPNAVLFTDRERHLVAISDIGVAFGVAAVGLLAWKLAIMAVFKLFFVPYMVLNTFMVIITLLQHTDTFVPRFRSESWTWLHGALCTVDRDFGLFMNNTLHHMPDTHVCHHIFSKIPFYHAVEATRALKPLLGRYYLKDDTPVVKALWRCYTHCKFVEDDGSVVFCKKKL